jgi:methionyl-tRNA synthetase
MVSFEEFKKLDLRVAKVIKAEKVEGSEKLLKLEIDLGNEQKQIIAGIAQQYKPEDLLGREIVVVANLEPKTVLGLESQGMLLAAEDEGRGEPVILIPAKDVPPGSKVH